ncbi:Zinc finger CCCH domain-containing protein 64 [Hibiscus syriacus]|uniref:Zinc finger CCCH domain-containing protein 64 n=1 Tax=Hibiscus syriacus TaxID=106335 RepID=A0A6A2XVK6_HIBSY|nr:Zinc finger CCCH domain-containing protein 64 [Hibiscus syriacus]
MYCRSTTYVRTTVGDTEAFPVEIGLHQGSALSPYIFALIMDDIYCATPDGVPWFMLFADDIVLVAESKTELNSRLSTWKTALEEKGLRINIEKTEYLCSNFSGNQNDEDVEICIEGHVLPSKDCFKYLGYMIRKDGGVDEVSHRIKAGWLKWRAATRVLCDKKVPLKLKGKFYRMAIRPALLYGSECWAIKKDHVRKMEAAEMRMLRWVCGRTLWDMIPNSAIRMSLGVVPVPLLQSSVQSTAPRHPALHSQRSLSISLMTPPRVILCGDVSGRLNQLIKRVNKSAGPFNALFCVGKFFPDESDRLNELMDYVEGWAQIPLPTYFIGDYGVGAPKVLSAVSRNSANQGFKMDGFKVCDNLYWLKGSGKFTLHGLSVAYLFGRESSNGQEFGTYGQDDIDTATPPDIPAGISDSSGSDSTVAQLVTEIKPRYHIAGTKGIFYAREPYSNIDVVHVTRFLGLASVVNKEKQKFLHALSPTPSSAMSAAEISAKPPNTTLSPYTLVDQVDHPKEATKRAGDNELDSQYWRYDVSNKRQKHGNGDANKESVKKVLIAILSTVYRMTVSYSRKRPGSSNSNANRSKECWFCLPSPDVESHLVTSIGENFYCALAKGPLVPDHVLMIPVEHLPNTLSLPADCQLELGKLQNSHKMYYKNQGKEAVFFEISKRGTHANLQAVFTLAAVPSSKAVVLKDIFTLAAEKLGFEFVTKKCSILLHLVEENEKFPAQFGREGAVHVNGTGIHASIDIHLGIGAVVAGLLSMADRADWRKCTISKEEETKLAENFKKRFQEVPNQLVEGCSMFGFQWYPLERAQ